MITFEVGHSLQNVGIALKKFLWIWQVLILNSSVEKIMDQSMHQLIPYTEANQKEKETF